MVFVIGSGPSGVSCAMALLERGASVTLLDGGETLEPGRAEQFNRLRVLPSSEWRGDAVDFMKNQAAADHKGIGIKHIYGSDYPYRQVANLLPLEKHGVDTTSSLATGGFSNVWGAAILPYRQDDIPNWPITSADLSPHYRAVLSFMDASMTDDDLAELFPLYTDRPQSLHASRQAETFLADLQKHRDALRRHGIWFGASRLAVRPNTASEKPGCAYCGLCMYGCPYELIYTATSTLARLSARPNFRHISGILVERLQESSGTVKIFARHRDENRPVEFEAERVYLGAGVLASTRIVLRSLDAWDRPVVMRDSQYFLLPLLRYAGQRGAIGESLHTLSQAFLEIRDRQLNDRTVHLQVYTYNDLYAGAMQKMSRVAWPLVKPLAGGVLGRLLIVQGYLHSDYSPSVRITLQRGSGSSDVLRLKAQDSELTRPLLKQLVRKLSRNSKYLRAKPLSFLMSQQLPGRGFHSGGTFPMRTHPEEFETDTLGRPTGFHRVHVVDSTVLPSIPATTITFSVMANAHRIGSAYEPS